MLHFTTAFIVSFSRITVYMYRAPEFWLEVPTGSKDEEATEGNRQAEDAEDAQASEVPSCAFLDGCGRVKYGQNTQANIKPVASIIELLRCIIYCTAVS